MTESGGFAAGPGGLAVVARDVVAGYGRADRGPDVLAGLSLEVEPGSVTAVVGPNGAGKSTLFRTLFGHLHPRAGQVTIGGRSPREHHARFGFGYLPEALALPRGWTVRSWIRAAAHLKGVPEGEVEDVVAGGIETMGLGAHRTARLETLSRGTARRAALAWVFTGRPPVVLLDEPLASLDAGARIRVRETLDRLAGPESTVLVATHELREVPLLAERAVVLSGGRIVASLGDPDPEEMEARIVESGWGHP